MAMFGFVCPCVVLYILCGNKEWTGLSINPWESRNGRGRPLTRGKVEMDCAVH